jgi:osmotically-inducible protein OsmY
VYAAPSGFHKRLGDVTDNRGTTSLGDSRAAVDDTALLSRVVSALQSDPALDGAALQVEVLGGVVGITGHAARSIQARRAGEVAARAANGARVETDIDVE